MTSISTTTAKTLQVIENTDLPALFIAADRGSVSAQKHYLNLFRSNIVFTVLGAIFAAVSFNATQYKNLPVWLTWFSFLSFITTFVLSTFIRLKKPESLWYGTREIAESAKTLAWRYMMQAGTFASLSPKDADHRFSADLLEILHQRPSIGGAFESKYNSAEQITGKMREIRALSLEERKDAYLKNRLMEQAVWYSKKAEYNQRREKRGFLIVMVLQIAACLSTLIPLAELNIPIRFTGILSTIIASCLAWIQIKRYQELANSYTMAAQELNMIAIKAEHIMTEEELSAFVLEAENAISREHTLWVAKRS